MDYVVGFMFSEDLKQVALIEKQKPAWQKGKLNGIGGKIEENEVPKDAMIREFEEEAGVHVDNWEFYLHMDWESQHNIYFFKAKGDLSRLRTMETEKIKIVEVNEIFWLNVIPNVRWLVPLALDKDGCYGNIYDGSSSKKNEVVR